MHWGGTDLFGGDDIMESYNAVAKFKVTCDGKIYHYVLERRQSGAFKYGNQSYVGMYVNGELRDSYDTRYDRECTVANFKRWSRKFMANYCRSDCVIEEED